MNKVESALFKCQNLIFFFVTIRNRNGHHPILTARLKKKRRLPLNLQIGELICIRLHGVELLVINPIRFTVF